MLTWRPDRVGQLARALRHLWVLGSWLAAGCAGPGTDIGDAETTGTTSAEDELHCSRSLDEDGEAWLELGQGVVAYEPLEPGGELRIVLGGQGLLMFAVDLRGGGFCVPPDLSDRDEFPVLDIELDVQGEPAPFIELTEQPIDFDILEDDSFVWMYLPLILPDAVEPETLVGRAVALTAHLEPHEHAPLEVAVEMVIGVEE